MYYKSFSIKSFRGIESVDLDLTNNRILTLVGLNESGKSTILTSLNIFYRMVKGNDPHEQEINTFRPKGIDFTGDISIQGRLAFEDNDVRKLKEYSMSRGIDQELSYPDLFSYTYKFSFNLHKYTATEKVAQFVITEKASGKPLHEENRPVWQEILDFVKQNLVPEILFYEDFIFDIPDKIIFSKSGQSDTNSRNLEWQLVLNDILKSVVQEFNSFQESVVNIWDTDNDTASNRITRMEGALNKKITQGWKELFKEHGKKSSDQRLNFKEIKLVPTSEGSNLAISFKVKTDTDKEFLINERSKGCKWFFSFLLFTEFRKNRTRDILFLLDEPASNLHSSAQKKIMEAINELSNGSMVIYSTHSHHMINPKWLSGAYVVINEVLSDKQLEGDMTFDDRGKISAEKYFSYIGKGMGKVKTSYFQPILDRLDYAPSEVEAVPDIIITEGKNDWYTFKYLSEVIFNQKDTFHFYPGAGRTQLSDIIRLYLAWGQNFLVILDGDNPGIQAKKGYRKDFNGFVDGRIYTLEDVFKRKWQTENLINDADKRMICDEIYGVGKFDAVKATAAQLKLTLNTAINQLLILNKQVPLCENTKQNFKTLFLFLEEHRSKLPHS